MTAAFNINLLRSDPKRRVHAGTYLLLAFLIALLSHARPAAAAGLSESRTFSDEYRRGLSGMETLTVDFDEATRARLNWSLRGTISQDTQITVTLYACDGLGDCFVQRTRNVEYRAGRIMDNWETEIDGERPDGTLFVVQAVYVEDTTAYSFPAIGVWR
jgi:hypothetical protein